MLVFDPVVIVKAFLIFFNQPPMEITKLYWTKDMLWSLVSLSLGSVILGRFYFWPVCQLVVHHCIMIIVFPVLSLMFYVWWLVHYSERGKKSLLNVVVVFLFINLSSFHLSSSTIFNQTCHKVFCKNINEGPCPFYQGEIIGI